MEQYEKEQSEKEQYEKINRFMQGLDEMYPDCVSSGFPDLFWDYYDELYDESEDKDLFTKYFTFMPIRDKIYIIACILYKDYAMLRGEGAPDGEKIITSWKQLSNEEKNTILEKAIDLMDVPTSGGKRRHIKGYKKSHKKHKPKRRKTRRCKR